MFGVIKFLIKFILVVTVIPAIILIVVILLKDKDVKEVVGKVKDEAEELPSILRAGVKEKSEEFKDQSSKFKKQNEIERKIKNRDGGKMKVGVNNSVDLTQRQEQILAIIRGEEQVYMADLLKKIKNVSERTVRRDLEKLQQLKKISQLGRTKDTRYIIY